MKVARYVQKCPPLARTQARKRAGHWSIASSISDCSNLCHTHSRPVAAHHCHELWFYTHDAECLQRAFILVARHVKDTKIRQSRVMITNVLPRFSYSKNALLLFSVYNVSIFIGVTHAIR